MNRHEIANQLKMIAMSNGALFDHQPNKCEDACNQAAYILETADFNYNNPDDKWISLNPSGFKCCRCGTLSKYATNFCSYCGKSLNKEDLNGNSGNQ